MYAHTHTIIVHCIHLGKQKINSLIWNVRPCWYDFPHKNHEKLGFGRTVFSRDSWHKQGPPACVCWFNFTFKVKTPQLKVSFWTHLPWPILDTLQIIANKSIANLVDYPILSKIDLTIWGFFIWFTGDPLDCSWGYHRMHISVYTYR